MTTETIYYDDEKAIGDLLMGKTVVKVGDDTLALSDGTVLTIVPNEGGCSCGAGDYSIDELNGCPNNAIMNVVIKQVEDEPYGDTHYQIFVLAEDRRIKLLDVSGNDGSGYYGTGYWIEVYKP
jgi:hypothetical protein